MCRRLRGPTKLNGQLASRRCGYPCSLNQWLMTKSLVFKQGSKGSSGNFTCISVIDKQKLKNVAFKMNRYKSADQNQANSLAQVRQTNISLLRFFCLKLLKRLTTYRICKLLFVKFSHKRNRLFLSFAVRLT